MPLQVFRDILDRRPFVPLRLILANGDRYNIPHRAATFLTQENIVVGIDFGNDGIPDGFKIISLENVSVIETINN